MRRRNFLGFAASGAAVAAAADHAFAQRAPDPDASLTAQRSGSNACLPDWSKLKSRTGAKTEVLYKTTHGKPNGLALTNKPGELWVIDHQTPPAVLHIAVKNHLMAGQQHITEIRHIEPPAGHLAGAEDILLPAGNHRLIKLTPRPKPTLRSIQHNTTQTNRRASRLHREGIESTTILVATRQPEQDIAHRAQTSRSKSRHLLRWHQPAFRQFLVHRHPQHAPLLTGIPGR